MSNVRPMLRATGNLSYLEFIRLVERMWLDSHPDIPFIPTGPKNPAVYPCIVYGLDVRKTHPNEPKLRYREVLTGDNNEALLVHSQRFQNIVTFSAVTESDPHLAERLIEIFENFMLEFTSVLKKCGVSEIVYSRRLPDSEENRQGQGVVKRTVSYLVTTEKIVIASYERIERMAIDARLYVESNNLETEEILPRTYGTPVFTVSGDLASIVVPRTNLRISDMVYLAPPYDGSLPGGVNSGYYLISNVIGTAYSDTIAYTIVRPRSDGTDNYDPVTITSTGTGRLMYVPDNEIETRIVDQYSSATPNY